MKSHERWQRLLHSPKMLSKVLFLGRYDYFLDLMPVNLKHMSFAKRFNFLKSCLNFGYRHTRPWSWPIHMQIELTNYCNLRCPVCPTGIGAMNRKPLAMDIQLFKQLMDEAGQYLITLCLWAWGESILHPQLADILRIAAQHNVVTILSSNGQNLNDEKIYEAIAAHPPTHLIVAIDGLTDETNALYRVGARLEPILAGVHRIANGKRENHAPYPLLQMRYMVMKHNQHELPQVRRFAKEHLFDLLTIRTLSNIDFDGGWHHGLLPDDDTFRAYQYDHSNRIHLKDFVCQHAFSFPTVLADGTVVVCDQDYNAQHPYGKVTRDRSFKDLWFSKSAATIRKTVRDTRENFSFCKNCPYADRPVSTCCILAFDLQE